MEHLDNSQARLVNGWHASPGSLELLMMCLDGYILITRIHVGKPAHVTRPLDVGLTAQRVHSATRYAHVAQQHLDVGARKHVLVPAGVLGNPHSIHESTWAVSGHQPRRAPDVLGRHVANLGYSLRWVFCYFSL